MCMWFHDGMEEVGASTMEVLEVCGTTINRKCPISHERCYGRGCVWALGVPITPRIQEGVGTYDKKAVAVVSAWRCTQNPYRPIVDVDVVRWVVKPKESVDCWEQTGSEWAGSGY